MSLLRDGLADTQRMSAEAVLGILYVAGGPNRLRRIASRGDPAVRGYEETFAGIQAPQFSLSATGETTGGAIVTTAASTIFLTCTFGSTRYIPDDQGSNPATPTSVSISGATTTGSIEAAATGFVEPPENNWGVTDVVDEVRFYRTLVNQTDVVADTPDADQLTIGSFYFCGRTSIHSFRSYSEWAGTTTYNPGDYAKKTDYPTAGQVTNFRCLVRHTSGTFSTDYVTNAYWLAVGQTPIVLDLSDTAITSDQNLLTLNRGLPPDGWSLMFYDNRLFSTGQKPYQLRVNVTKSSATVTTWQPTDGTPRDRVPDGIVNRQFQLASDGTIYGVAGWLDEYTFVLHKVYGGATATGQLANITPVDGMIAYTEADEDGIVGLPLPDAWVANTADGNYVIYDPDGLGNEAVVSGRQGWAVFKRNGFGWASGLETPKPVEKVTVLTLGNRGIAVGKAGEIYFISSDGIRVTDGPTPSQRITDAVRDLWEPRPEQIRDGLYWNRERLDRGLLHFHPRLEWLAMAAPLRSSEYNNLVLICDRTAPNLAACSLFRFFVDTAIGTPCDIDITAAETVLIDGQEELLLAGQLITDDPRFIGRIWELGDRRTFRDELPIDKLVSSAAIVHHGIPFQREFKPLVAQQSEAVRIHGIKIITQVVENGGTFGVVCRVQPDYGVEETPTTAVECSLRQKANVLAPVLPSGGFPQGIRVTVVPYGTVRSPQDEVVIEELHAQVAVMSRGGRM